MFRQDKEKEVTTKTANTDESSSVSDSSDGSKAGGADASTTSFSSNEGPWPKLFVTQNEIVGEKEDSFWDEYYDFKLALLKKGGLSACFQQFRSTVLTCELPTKLGTTWFVSTVICVILVATICNVPGAQQQNDESTSLSSKLNSNLQQQQQLPLVPTAQPSLVPSDLPSMVPSGMPSDGPSSVPSHVPTTLAPTQKPTPNPTPPPTREPTRNPTPPPTREPTPPPTPPPPTAQRITYVPGKLTHRQNGLLLSEGLQSRLVARTGSRVVLDGRNHEKSDRAFHDLPDGAAVFEDPDTGGWVYVSNSEVQARGQGGVGGIYFDRHGRTTDYKMLARNVGMTANCSGGKTPWNTWVTCEETENGRALQVDPFGSRGIQELNMDRGYFEAFAHDIRDRNHPRFFVTEDKERGPIRRFSPSNPNWDDPWQLLHGPGTLEYLVIEPRGGNKGTFRWTTDKGYAKTNAALYYPYTEGIDVWRHELFFTTKERKELYILHLDNKTFEKQSTVSGVFDGMPDQVKRIVGDGLLYFCEEGGVENGVHARDENGWYFTVLETDSFNDESTGLAFSPNGKRMYVAFQHSGKIFDIWREDGLPFHGQTLSVRYHEFKERR